MANKINTRRFGNTKEKTMQEQIKTERNTGAFCWMKAHLLWHHLLPAPANLDIFKHIDPILIYSMQLCTSARQRTHWLTEANARAWKHTSAVVCSSRAGEARYKAAVNQWGKSFIGFPRTRSSIWLRSYSECIRSRKRWPLFHRPNAPTNYNMYQNC